ncbi:MAG: sensor histidine kinase [Candidatus Acidiferrales bacterium]
MKRLTFERRVLLLALAAGLPGSGVALALLWTGDFSSRVAWTLTLLIVGVWLGFAFALRHRVAFPLQTLSNILAAIREEDFSMRARGAGYGDAMGEVLIEVNALGETLREQRLGALEASALLRKVIQEIDVAVFTFDENNRLRLVNRAGERLLAEPSERLLGATAEDLGLAACLSGESGRTLDMSFPGRAGRWDIRHGSFREGGLPHRLLVLSDLSRALREEERQAWQRLIRVIGHELNNSLAPIQSVAESLETNLVRATGASRGSEFTGMSAESADDMKKGLGVIRARTEALGRFMAAYAQLARLPQPNLGPVEVSAWVHRVAGLETRLTVSVVEGPPMEISADGDQLEHLLINLVHNAADAALETGGGVRVGWERGRRQLTVWVEDDGLGLSNTANLFVPFFTTKQGGSGIGLVLSRQIAEAHGGSLTLENRRKGRGCVATLRLPLAATADGAR